MLLFRPLVRPAPPAPFEKSPPSFLLRPWSGGISILLAIGFVLLWAACHKEIPISHQVYEPVDFSGTYKASKLTAGHTNVYWMKLAGHRFALTREQSGTFVTFVDTIPAYTELHNTPLYFTGVTILDTSQVRLFSDGSLGIPRFDTTVGYTRKYSTFTVDITLSGKPLILRLGGYGPTRSFSLIAAWFAYSYRPSASPDQPRYTPVRTLLTDTNELIAVPMALAADTLGFGQGDTLAIRAETIIFK